MAKTTITKKTMAARQGAAGLISQVAAKQAAAKQAAAKKAVTRARERVRTMSIKLAPDGTAVAAVNMKIRGKRAASKAQPPTGIYSAAKEGAAYVTLPSGRIVSVSDAVAAAKRAGIITPRGKLSKFYASK